MALTSDQKKHLLIGGGVGALALIAGYALLGGRKAFAGALPAGHHAEHHGHRQKHHEGGGEGENDRGEYGKKKHKHHHDGEHGHGHD